MKYKYTILVIILSFLLSGYEDTGKVKKGYSSVRFTGSKTTAEFRRKLIENKIQFYTYKDENGVMFFAYPSKDTEKINKITLELIGTAKSTENTKNLCTNSKKQQDTLVRILQKNNITYTTYVDLEVDRYCVYWPISEDAKVEKAFPIYKKMKKSCNENPKCRNKI